ncbi:MULTISPECIES: GyrI-like domain-containing protein [Paenibacillus]|uniref:GyrI-like domain-containing protein n=1 Tax=Paenibacillus TaxID=44249 RepID=UPI0020CEEB3A|nr:GyrI-like domain-containing protein [Paenibacillus odorifer]MEC0131238.1 GyrI-like domain-containing protein [Paenibacillus odorifer]MEC0221799.1 GyrI-like domain-containing protein [Paenibacillus odorifer]
MKPNMTHRRHVRYARIQKKIGGSKMPKHEYRKHEKELYQPKAKPQLLEVGKQKFICIKGKGNPNHEDFSERVGVLYSLAYAVKMMPKNGFTPEGYFDYTVYPLEGLWDLTEEGRNHKDLIKDELLYTIMIRQPDFVTRETVERAFEIVNKKKPHPLLKEAYFDELEDGLSVQILHIGSYDSEPESFQQLKMFIDENNYVLKTLVHREIYLSDARKVEHDKLKTILRYRINKK